MLLPREKIQSIDPGHDPQGRFPHRCGPVIERGPGQPQQRALAADAEVRVFVIDQLAQFTGIRAAEIFFEPLQLHLKPSDLLEQLGLFGLPLLIVLGLLAPGEQLAGAVQQLTLPLTHLDRVDCMVCSDLLDRLAATDRLHGDPGLELGTVGAAFAHRWEPPFRGGAPPQRLTMGAVQESQTSSG